MMEWTHGFSVSMCLGSGSIPFTITHIDPHLSANKPFLVSNDKNMFGGGPARSSKDGAKRGARMAGRKTRQEVEELMQKCIDKKIVDITELKLLCKAR